MPHRRLLYAAYTPCLVTPYIRRIHTLHIRRIYSPYLFIADIRRFRRTYAKYFYGVYICRLGGVYICRIYTLYLPRTCTPHVRRITMPYIHCMYADSYGVYIYIYIYVGAERAFPSSPLGTGRAASGRTAGGGRDLQLVVVLVLMYTRNASGSVRIAP